MKTYKKNVAKVGFFHLLDIIETAKGGREYFLIKTIIYGFE